MVILSNRAGDMKLKLTKRVGKLGPKYVTPAPKEVADHGFDSVSSDGCRSDDRFADLRAYPSMEETKEALRHIPADLAEALQVVPELFLDATCKLHGQFSHWSTRLAYAKAAHTATKLAREVGLERQKDVVRTASNALNGKAVSETLVTSKAKASDEYADLCLCEVESEKECLRIKALVDTLSTKKAALRILSFYTKPEIDAAKMAYVTGDD